SGESRIDVVSLVIMRMLSMEVVIVMIVVRMMMNQFLSQLTKNVLEMIDLRSASGAALQESFLFSSRSSLGQTEFASTLDCLILGGIDSNSLSLLVSDEETTGGSLHHSSEESVVLSLLVTLRLSVDLTLKESGGVSLSLSDGKSSSVAVCEATLVANSVHLLESGGAIAGSVPVMSMMMSKMVVVMVMMVVVIIVIMIVVVSMASESISSEDGNGNGNVGILLTVDYVSLVVDIGILCPCSGCNYEEKSDEGCTHP
ncbi:hypothetical protein PFISCL1PPCAC_26946, partial [Pristionchus fissidentatus]